MNDMKVFADNNQLLDKVSHHIDTARSNISNSVNFEMVQAYWLIGREIVEEEQQGKQRAEYGAGLLRYLAEKLTAKYGKGFGHENIKRMRQFYLAYADSTPIGYAVHTQFNKSLNPNLGWIHYRALMRVNRVEARSFYEIEAVKNNWSGRELERQINSLLFDRLAKSKDKQDLLQLANQGQIITKPVDVLKDPILTVKFVMKTTIRLLGWYYARRKVTQW